MADHLVRILSEDGTLRGAVCDSTELVRQICLKQGTDITASIALGRLCTGAALMGALLKGRQRLALMVEGNGPLKKLHAETDAQGNLRASVKEPISGLPPKDGGFDVAGAVGKAGFLHVIKDLGLKEPYRSMVMLQTSEIAEDLAYYLTTSEQVPSLVVCGVLLGPDGTVAAAGGLLIQSMPPGNPELIAKLEQRFAELPPLSRTIAEGGSALDILDALFEGIAYNKILEIPLQFKCSCSQAQIGRVLRTMGREEVESVLAEQGEVTVCCEYCRESYCFDAPGIDAVFA